MTVFVSYMTLEFRSFVMLTLSTTLIFLHLCIGICLQTLLHIYEQGYLQTNQNYIHCK